MPDDAASAACESARVRIQRLVAAEAERTGAEPRELRINAGLYHEFLEELVALQRLDPPKIRYTYEPATPKDARRARWLPQWVLDRWPGLVKWRAERHLCPEGPGFQVLKFCNTTLVPRKAPAP